MKNFYTRIFICVAILPATNIVRAQVNTQDSIALVNLYNSTHGPTWKRNDNWLSTFSPLNTWYGVSVANNRVTALSLNDNLLEGILSPALGDITGLDSLSLSGNSLTGSISSSYGNLTNLLFFDISANQLNDIIPASLGNLPNLKYLNLSNNYFTGTIPASLGNLPNLQVLNLSFNRLKGNLPFFSTASNLERLDLSYNQLSGDFPSSVNNLSNLTDLILGSNNITGNIPAGLGNLTELQNADLSNNFLSGNIPFSLGNLSKLQQLLLHENELSGNIPSSLNNLISLNLVNLSYNELSGDIPSSFGNLINLQELNLSYNQLSGNIPSSLGNLSNLNVLFLNNNGLSGTVPSLTNLSNLNSLDLSNNQFTFSGMESVAQTFSFATYAPQANISLHKNGNTLSVSAGGTLSNDSFYWYKNGTLDTIITGDSVFVVTDIGQYFVIVTNSVATQLTLYSDTADITVLPVRLISLTGSLINDNAVLNWKTAQEMNSSHFNILRSKDAVRFSKIGEIKSAGNSNNVINYTYTDASAIKTGAPKLFYRLEQVDNDGKIQLSNTISIDILKTTIALYPNPASNFIYLDLPQEFLHNASVVVYDMNGKKVLQQNVASNSHQQINISKLSQGIYNLVILQDGKKLMVRSFVAER